MAAEEKLDLSKTNTQPIFEKLIQFLRSPMWVLPVMSFMEQRSLVFDQLEIDDNLFKQIHVEFQSMCFCDDLGIKPQTVAEAIRKDVSRTNVSSMEHTVLEPLIAAHDYSIFIHMMIRKNIELQLQALEMIQIVYGLIPAVLRPAGEEELLAQAGDEQERMVMIEVIRQSKEDYEREKSNNAKTEMELEFAIKESLLERERLEKKRKEELELSQKAMGLRLTGSPRDNESVSETVATAKATAHTPSESETTQNRKQSMIETTSANKAELPPLKPRAMSTHFEEMPALSSSKPSLSKVSEIAEASNTKPNSIPPIVASANATSGASQSLQSRQEYLRLQRDKLLNIKREARVKAFNDAEQRSSGAGNARPRTARAVKNILRGKPISETGKTGSGAAVTVAMDSDVIAARKALAEKLKSQVGGI